MKHEDTIKAERATRIMEVAEELCDREGARAQAEGILQAPDMVSVFAVACAMSIIRLRELNDQLAGTALRTMIKNLMIQGVEIPEL